MFSFWLKFGPFLSPSSCSFCKKWVTSITIVSSFFLRTIWANWKVPSFQHGHSTLVLRIWPRKGHIKRLPFVPLWKFPSRLESHQGWEIIFFQKARTFCAIQRLRQKLSKLSFTVSSLPFLPDNCSCQKKWESVPLARTKTECLGMGLTRRCFFPSGKGRLHYFCIIFWQVWSKPLQPSLALGATRENPMSGLESGLQKGEYTPATMAWVQETRKKRVVGRKSRVQEMQRAKGRIFDGQWVDVTQ